MTGDRAADMNIGGDAHRADMLASHSEWNSSMKADRDAYRAETRSARPDWSTGSKAERSETCYASSDCSMHHSDGPSVSDFLDLAVTCARLFLTAEDMYARVKARNAASIPEPINSGSELSSITIGNKNNSSVSHNTLEHKNAEASPMPSSKSLDMDEFKAMFTKLKEDGRAKMIGMYGRAKEEGRSKVNKMRETAKEEHLKAVSEPSPLDEYKAKFTKVMKEGRDKMNGMCEMAMEERAAKENEMRERAKQAHLKSIAKRTCDVHLKNCQFHSDEYLTCVEKYLGCKRSLERAESQSQ